MNARMTTTLPCRLLGSYLETAINRPKLNGVLAVDDRKQLKAVFLFRSNLIFVGG